MHPNAIGQHRLALLHVRGQEQLQQRLDTVQELVGQLERRRRSPAPAASRPVIGRNSSTQCGFGRNRQSNTRSASGGHAVLVAERHDRDLGAFATGGVAEQVDHLPAQVVHVQLAGVDHDVGGLADGPRGDAAPPRSLPRPSRSRRAAGGGAWCRRSGAPASGSTASRNTVVTVAPGGCAARRAPGRRRTGRPRTRRPARPVSSASDWKRASSATFGISSDGRLSMTNQPRSSSVLPTWVRPAPDRPVTTTNSTIRQGYRRAVGGPSRAARASRKSSDVCASVTRVGRRRRTEHTLSRRQVQCVPDS